MTYREDLAPPRVRPRAAFLPLLAGFLLLAGALALPAAAQGPRGAARPEPPRNPGTDRAANRAEAAVAGLLARLDEELGLGTTPDVSALWPARMAAAIEARGEDEPAQDLLSRVAVELRGLGGEWTFGGPPGGKPDGRPAVSETTGRERAERITRLRRLVDLALEKLSLAEGSQAVSSPSATGTIGRRNHLYGGEDCAAAVTLGLGYYEGDTFGSTPDGASSCDGSSPSPDVWYRFVAPEAGVYTFETLDLFYGTYDTVLSLHDGCPTPDDDRELVCSDDTGSSLLSSIVRPMGAGEQVLLRVAGYGGSVGNYLLRLSVGREIRGTVHREGTGTPITGATVEIRDYDAQVLTTASSNADGEYTAEIASTVYDVYAFAREDGSVAKYYQDHSCGFAMYCSTYYATHLNVENGDLTGIDFHLAPAGRISGAIRSSRDGQALDAFAYLYESDGTLVGSIAQDAAEGSFEMSGVPPGDYHVRGSAAGHQGETWDDVPCHSSSCDPTTGRVVSVTAGSVAEVDFVLEPLGAIEGTVTDADSGDPLMNTTLYLFGETGQYYGSVYSQSDGTYEAFGRPPEQHFVRTGTSSYFDQLYDGIDCAESCDPTTGTPVVPQLGTTISGIDFALTARARIIGTVTDAVTGLPIRQRIELHDDTGQYLYWTASSAETGEFRFSGLEAGTYYLWANSNFGDYEPQLYQNRLCPLDCDTTAGTPVVVTATSQVTGIDFALSRRGWITGKITDFVTGNGLWDDWYVGVAAYDANGDLRGWYSYLGPNGEYEIRNLVSGDYRVGAWVDSWGDDHRPEMWNDVPCGRPCDRTSGHPVTVSPAQETPGIDLALNRYGKLSGAVHDTSSPSGGVDATVYLLDAVTQEIAYQYSAWSSFFFSGIEPGSYYLLARSGDWEGDYQDEVYPDVPCDPDCDVTLGTPIVVTVDSNQTGIDFHLTPCPAPSFAEVASTTVGSYSKVLACESITVENATVGFGGELLLRAGKKVVFGNGFAVEDGGSLKVVIEPDWADP